MSKPALLLANENIPAASIRLLRSRGYTIASIREDSPGVDDRQVLQRACTQQRCLLTFDMDYGALIFQAGLPPPPALVLFRLSRFQPVTPAERLIALLEQPEVPSTGYFTIGDESIRWRPWP